MEKRKVYCYNIQTKKFVKEFEGLRQAARELDIHFTSIRAACLNKNPYGGYFWSYEKMQYFKEGSLTRTYNKKPVLLETRSKGENEPSIKINPTLQKILETYTPSELQAIASGCKILPSVQKVPTINFDGEHIRIGVMGDTHLGSSYTSEQNIYKAFEEFEKADVDFMVHTGDVTEGMSNRPGHIYELSHLGYDKMKNHAIDVLGQCPVPSYYIDGNHDRWFIKSNGALIVKDICDAIDDATFLGHDEGDIKLKDNVTLRLWHGEDGNSYATSYRIQKVVESLSGGEKPNILLLGHTHKQAYIFERNIQCVSTGCMQYQTPWMRGKRISAHIGFHIIDVWVNSKGVSKFGVTWFPIYSGPIK